MNIGEKSINTIRTLGIDAINKANSGHPGIVMGAAPMAYTLFANSLNITPNHPKWVNRDRFILAAGHGSMLLYSLLHLSGYDISIDDIKQFRQWDSKLPGHPEYGHTDGVDATSGPLGQGIPMGVGMALAENFLAAKFNKENYPLFDHYTYVLCGDGDLQEGVTLEATSFAGHLGLDKLIVLYDSNDIQLDGPTRMTVSEDVKTKFEASNWQYLKVEDGNDVKAINDALCDARENTTQPTIIEIKTIIGYGSPLAGDSASHGAPLGDVNTEKTKQTYGWDYEKFEVCQDVYDHFQQAVVKQGDESYSDWRKLFDEYCQNFEEGKLLQDVLNNKYQINWDELNCFSDNLNEATRVTSGKLIDFINQSLPTFIGGSADLTKSTKAKGGDGDFSIENRLGRNINFGVREHAMGAIVNGMTLHSGVKAFGSCFFVFSDYLKPSMRMAALMNIPSIFVFTHDSIAVGEDGPTHQPIEQLAGLRAIPNLLVYRPGNANETRYAWQIAVESKTNPVALVLTRQNLVNDERSTYEGVSKGGYIISKEDNNIDAILLASGSEVNLAIKAQNSLKKNGIDTRVVSIPCFKRFNEQSCDYKESVLPKEIRSRIAIEMANDNSWYQYVGIDGKLITIEGFGSSAPGDIVTEKFGYNVDNIVKNVTELLNK